MPLLEQLNHVNLYFLLVCELFFLQSLSIILVGNYENYYFKVSGLSLAN